MNLSPGILTLVTILAINFAAPFHQARAEGGEAQVQNTLRTLNCRSQLAIYIHAMNDQEYIDLAQSVEDKKTLLNAIADKLVLAEEITSDDKIRYSQAERLAPLFENGIVHRAIAKEFVSRGYKNKKSMSRALKAFNSIVNENEKINIVQSIANRLAYMIDEDISLDNGKLKEIEKKAKNLKMPFADYLSFIKAWNRQRKIDFSVVEIVIAQMLISEELSPNATDFSKKVVGNVSWFSKAMNLFAKDVAPPAIPKKTDVKYSDLALGGAEAFTTSDLTTFFEKSPLSIIQSFLENNFGSLTLNQLQSFLADARLQDGLSEDVKSKMSRRLRQFTQDSFEYDKALAELKDVNNKIAAATASKDEILYGYRNSGMTSEVLYSIVNMVSQHTPVYLSTSAMAVEYEALGAFYSGIGGTYVGQANPAQFTNILVAALKRLKAVQTHYYNVWDPKKAAVIESYREASTRMNLTPSQIAEIKAAGQDAMQDLREAGAVKKANDALQGVWGQAHNTAQNSEKSEEVKKIEETIISLERTKTEIDGRLKQIANQLKEKLSDASP